MGESVHAAALEGVDADPLQLELSLVTQHGTDAGNHVFRFFLFFWISLPSQLEVYTPYVIGLLV